MSCPPRELGREACNVVSLLLYGTVSLTSQASWGIIWETEAKAIFHNGNVRTER